MNGIELSCLPPLRLVPQLDNGYLEYKDEKSGEYKCEDPDSKESQKIYVKFRSESRAADELDFIWSHLPNVCVCVCV